MKNLSISNKKGQLLTILIIVVLAGFALYFIFSGSEESSSTDTTVPTQQDQGLLDVTEEEEVDAQVSIDEDDSDEPITQEWRDILLTNVHDNTLYTFNSLSDKPVVMESFAVWCPTCTRQQKELKKLHADPEFGDKFHSVGLNTDQNEGADKILDHAEKNGFDWRYSVSPPELTNALIDEFGISVVNAPSAPVILICQNGGGTHFLEKGVKRADEIKLEIASKCLV